MCGIAGVLGAGANDRALLSCMARVIAHRGPDDEGVWADPAAGVGLVNRRLAIIDLTPAGHQPMKSHDGSLMLTFNGEIYNHDELRQALADAGAAPIGGWSGHSDTEALLQALSVWGVEQTLQRCVGMFAFAVWDQKRRRLTLVRDRFGEKPLYYGWLGNDFVFASELKSFRVHPRFKGDIDRRALALYAARNYVPAPLSIYRGIYKLEPGCILELSAEGASKPLGSAPAVGHSSSGFSIGRYWSYRDVLRAGLAQRIANEHEALEQLEPTLASAVTSQSIADVPVGAFLSGGIDSSCVVALYQKYSRHRVRTFTIGFEDSRYNEAAYARKVARHFGTEHHEHYVTANEARDVITLLPRMYDEPFSDSSQIPTFLVSKFAREHITVALSGDGGDELFGGYNRYFAAQLVWSRLSVLPYPLRVAAGATLGQIPAGVWDRSAQLISGQRLPPHFGAKVQRWFQTIACARGLNDVFGMFLNEWAAEGTPVIGAANVQPALDLDVAEGAPDALRMMYYDAMTYLPDDILCKVDRASMAVSLEVHVPFLDHRVAELAARIPIEMKVSGGAGKRILKDLLYRHAPRELFERPKTGFGIPVGQWINGPLRDWAESLLDSRRMAQEGLLDVGAVQQRWADHLSGRRDSTAAIWSVLMLQAWLDEQRSMDAIAA